MCIRDRLHTSAALLLPRRDNADGHTLELNPDHPLVAQLAQGVSWTLVLSPVALRRRVPWLNVDGVALVDMRGRSVGEWEILDRIDLAGSNCDS
mgnify:CR=1 FL=1